jgi:hypothetical protein
VVAILDFFFDFFLDFFSVFLSFFAFFLALLSADFSAGAAAGAVAGTATGAGAGSAAITEIGVMPIVTEIRDAKLKRTKRETIEFSKKDCEFFNNTQKI